MQVKKAIFISSNSDVAQCPEPARPEFAFIGRSNVGKSSLINAFTNQKDLAKVSGKPGKTRLINHFLINDAWYLVDLPGYGYAAVGKKDRVQFQQMALDYIEKRPNLLCTFLLVDIRVEPQQIDFEFMEWLGLKRIPFCIAFTKADKLRPAELEQALIQYRQFILQEWEEMPLAFVTSAESKKGLDELRAFIAETSQSFVPPKEERKGRFQPPLRRK